MSDRDKAKAEDEFATLEELEPLDQAEEPARPAAKAASSGSSGSAAPRAEGRGQVESAGGSARVAPAPSPKGAGAQADGLSDLIASYSIVPIPVAIVDGSTRFVYANGPFEALVGSFGGRLGSSLLDAIGRFLGPETGAKLYASLRDSGRGYSWGGTIHFRSKTASGVIAKTTIVPHWHGKAAGRPPQAWVIFIDDVTIEHNTLIRGLFSSLLEASKLKDNDTGRHIERVNRYAELLASEMYKRGSWPEVDVDFVESIGFLAAMHDVGKIGTPDDILNKKGPLDEFEWNIMKDHTINGAFILSSYPNPLAKQVAQSHHEWWNGSGYPYKLLGDMIPLSARITAIADVYDALRMKRSYKEPFDHARASLLIVADGGSHFDPALVSVFKAVEKGFDEIFATYADAG